jgi:hypothetical protein
MCEFVRRKLDDITPFLRYISYYGQLYRVPDAYISRRVWTVLKGQTLKIECGKETIARYHLKWTILKIKTATAEMWSYIIDVVDSHFAQW